MDESLKEPEKGRQFIEGRETKPLEADPSHLRLLYYLQQAGRLVDFLKEDLTGISDAQVGAAARKVQQECAQAIEELVTIRPLRDEKEGATIQVPKNYHPGECKIVGKVKGEPPFVGTLIHRGWKAQKRSLPKKSGEQVSDVICPAEIEVKVKG